MRFQQVEHLSHGKHSIFSSIIDATYSRALVSFRPRTCPKYEATAVLLGQKPILRSMAKRHLSLYERIIPHSLLWVQVVRLTDKVSLFSGKGDFLLCPFMPP
jgi:hypothetical protein